MDLEEWKAELAASPGKLATEASKVVKKGALEIKKTARATAGGSKSNAGRHINFDMVGADTAEIGYDKTGSGNLGTMREYGSAGNVPHNDLGQALESEAPTVEKFLVKALASSWR